MSGNILSKELAPSGWIGVDLDGTLAYYDGWRGAEHIGEPIPAMLKRVKDWLSDGIEVRIFTARAFDPSQVPYVHDWCVKNGLPRLAVTNVKDFAMRELWDDRCVQVLPNTGEAVT
jgi:hypothetical protein